MRLSFSEVYRAWVWSCEFIEHNVTFGLRSTMRLSTSILAAVAGQLTIASVINIQIITDDIAAVSPATNSLVSIFSTPGRHVKTMSCDDDFDESYKDCLINTGDKPDWWASPAEFISFDSLTLAIIARRTGMSVIKIAITETPKTTTKRLIISRLLAVKVTVTRITPIAWGTVVTKQDGKIILQPLQRLIC